MIHLFELQFQVQKNIYFTDRIKTNSYNIYYNKEIPETYWNYAVISDICSVKGLLPNLKKEFARLNRPVHIQVNSFDGNNLDELQNNHFKVSISDTWMRYEGGLKSPSNIKAHLADTKFDKDNYLKAFEKYYSNPNPYVASVTPQLLDAVIKSFAMPHVIPFIVYDGTHTVATASIGIYDNYALMFNITLDPQYAETEYPTALVSACIDYCKKNKLSSLNIHLLTSHSREKWYYNHGFKRISGGCRMIL